MFVNNLMGENGTKTITTGESGDSGVVYSAAVIMEDAVISALTMPEDAGSDNHIGPTYYAGQVIFGQITAITLTSGTVTLIVQHTQGIQ